MFEPFVRTQVEEARKPAAEGNESEMDNLLSEAIATAKYYGVDVSETVVEIKLLGRYNGEKRNLVDTMDHDARYGVSPEIYLMENRKIHSFDTGMFLICAGYVIERWRNQIKRNDSG